MGCMDAPRPSNVQNHGASLAEDPPFRDDIAKEASQVIAMFDIQRIQLSKNFISYVQCFGATKTGKNGTITDVFRVSGAERNHHHLLSKLHIRQAAKQNNGETGSFEVCSLSLQKQLLSLRWMGHLS